MGLVLRETERGMTSPQLTQIDGRRLTSLSGFGAHSSDNRGDLDIIVPHVWISGWCVQTLTTERKRTVKEECH